MSLFNYTALDVDGAKRQGTIDAVNIDVAITALQRRNLVVSAIDPVLQRVSLFSHLSFLDHITYSYIVMLSPQITTFCEA